MSEGFLLTKKTGLFEMDDIDAQITFVKQITITKTTQKISIEKELIVVNRHLTLILQCFRNIYDFK